MRVRAIKVKPLSNYCIQVWYEDGKIVIYDVSKDIQTIKIFHHLKDEENFQKVYLQYGGYAIAFGDGDEFEDPTIDCDVPYDEGEVLISTV
ncbi:hypothetical protein ACM0QA_00740 [Streptococcus pluranimalium]